MRPKSGAWLELIGLDDRLDRLLREVCGLLGDEDGERVRLARLLELGLDPRLPAAGLDLLRLRDVACDRDLDLGSHAGSSGSGGADCTRLADTARLTRRGTPRSGYGTSTASKSLGTTVSGKIARASSAISGPK